MRLRALRHTYSRLWHPLLYNRQGKVSRTKAATAVVTASLQMEWGPSRAGMIKDPSPAQPRIIPVNPEDELQTHRNFSRWVRCVKLCPSRNEKVH